MHPLPLQGWNADVIVDADGAQGGDLAFDPVGSAWTWFETGWSERPDGLPAGRSFTSESNPEILYQLQPARADNCLYLPFPAFYEGRFEATGALSLTVPAELRRLAILASSFGGGGEGELTLHFEDGTSHRMTYSSEDWWTNDDRSAPFGISGLGRMGKPTGDQTYHSGRDFGFGLYETVIDLEQLQLSDRHLLSMEFNKTAGDGTGIFAISGEYAELQPARLQMGYHVQWTDHRKDFDLETATAADGPWMPYLGTIQTVSGQHSALMDLSERFKLFRLVRED